MGKDAFKAGLFTLVALGVLSVFIVLISGFNPWRQLTEYRTRFRMAVGLGAGTPVRMNGVPIGQVISLKLVDEGTMVEVLFGLDGNARLRQGVRAQQATVGLLGDNYLLLIQEKTGGGEIAPGAVIPSLEKLDMAQTMTALGRLAGRAELILSDIQRVVNPSNMDHLASSLDQWQTSVGDMLNELRSSASYINGLMAEAKVLMVDARGLVKHTDGAVAQARDKAVRLLSEATDRINEVASRAKVLADALNRAVDEDQARVVKILDSGVNTMDRVEDVSRRAVDISKRVDDISKRAKRAADISLEELVIISRNLSDASRNVAQLAERLRDNPSLLIRPARMRR